MSASLLPLSASPPLEGKEGARQVQPFLVHTDIEPAEDTQQS